MVTSDAITEALRNVIDPELHRDVVDLDMVGAIDISDDGAVAVEITLTTPGCPLKNEISGQVKKHVGAVEGVTDVDVTFGAMNQTQRSALKDKLQSGRSDRKGLSVPRSCRVIAVTSGKGGVGKSTVTANLALAMAATGKRVGVMDADVYGYSIPDMLGISQKPVTVDRMIVPPVAFGINLMSIGFFLDDDAAVMWRGPMLHRALEQFLGDVHWGDLDYLFIDMPPGTGDVAISLGQLLPRAEVLVVTTPQIAAQTVARRAALGALTLEQHVLGVVENMSGREGEESMFGEGGGEALASSLQVPLLGTVTLDRGIREGGDAGVPVAVADSSGSAAARSEFESIVSAIEQRKPAPEPEPEPTGAERIKKPLTML